MICWAPARPSIPKAIVFPADTLDRVNHPFHVLGVDIAAADDDDVLDSAADHQFAVERVGQIPGV